MILVLSAFVRTFSLLRVERSLLVGTHTADTQPFAKRPSRRAVPDHVSPGETTAAVAVRQQLSKRTGCEARESEGEREKESSYFDSFSPMPSVPLIARERARRTVVRQRRTAAETLNARRAGGEPVPPPRTDRFDPSTPVDAQTHPSRPPSRPPSFLYLRACTVLPDFG